MEESSNAVAPQPSAVGPSPAGTSTPPAGEIASLYCQTAVVKIGELFGEFSLEVFRLSLPPPPSTTTMKRQREHLLDNVGGRCAEEDAIVVAAPPAAGMGDAAASRGIEKSGAAPLLTSAECAANGVSLWRLLIFTSGVVEEELSDVAAMTSELHWNEAEDPTPRSATVLFDQVMPTTKLTKIVKLVAGTRYTVLGRCLQKTTGRWSPWSEPVFTATMHPVVARLTEIGSDYVHIMWDRSAQRSTSQLTPEKDAISTQWISGVPNFELRGLREVDMVEAFHTTFEAGCRSHTVHGLLAGTAYIILMRYETLIHTMREWMEVGRFYTETAISVDLVSRAENVFSFTWHREDLLGDLVGYVLPHVQVHQYEIIVESLGMRFDPIIKSAAETEHTMEEMFPGTTYTVYVRDLSVQGYWGGRSKPLNVRTADRPTVSIAMTGETFASFTWSRDKEEPAEAKVEYQVQCLTSEYNRKEEVDLSNATARMLHVEHLSSGTDYTISLRTYLDGAWGIWTDAKRFATSPSAALTFLERGEDFLTLDWPTAGLRKIASSSDEPPAVYNVVVVKCDSQSERTVVMNERVTRMEDQKGFRINRLEAATTYDVQCRTWQRNPMTGYEGWGEFSAPVQMQTLQPVALHVWDVGEDFIHIVWRRGLLENGGAISTDENEAVAGLDGNALKYEVVVGCVDTGEDSILHRQVLDTSYTIAQLKPSTTYTVAVRVCDEQGQWGLWSRIKIRTLASVVTFVHEIGEDFVRLVWQRCDADEEADMVGVTAADKFVSQYSVFVYAKELPGIPVEPHEESGYPAGGHVDVTRHEVVPSEHTSLRVSELLPDREYVAVVRAATASGRWGLWSHPVVFRTNPQFRIPVNQLTIGENYVNLTWSRDEEPAALEDEASGETPVLYGDMTVTGQQVRVHGVTTQYAKEYTLAADLRKLKVHGLQPACAYTIEIRTCGKSGCWGLWSTPVHILTRGTIIVKALEVAEDFVTVSWERRKVVNPNQYPTGRSAVTSYHLRAYNAQGVQQETFLGDGDCPYRVTGLDVNTYYCIELKANYSDEEWGLWSTPLWCLTMQPMQIQTRLISEEFCCLQLTRPNQQRRLPEDDGNIMTEERILANGCLRPTIMLCVTSPILTKAPYSTSGYTKSSFHDDSLPPDAADHRLIYQTELVSSAEMVEHKVTNLKCNTVYSVSVRTKLANSEWGMWSPSVTFATVPATCVSFTNIGESFLNVQWERHKQILPPQLPHPEKVVLGMASIAASRVRVREVSGTYQHTYTVEGATSELRIDNLSPSTTYFVCVQTFNDAYEWGVWSEESKVRTVPGMEINVQHVSENSLWVAWSRRTDLNALGDADTVLNVSIVAKAYEVCITGEGGFRHIQETSASTLFFRGLLPDSVYAIHVRALFLEENRSGLWSSLLFRTKPRLRVNFGSIGEHFVMLEWRRHLPKPTHTEVVAALANRENSLENDLISLPRGGTHLQQQQYAHRHSIASIAETDDVVQQFRFKVLRVGDAQPVVYDIAPSVSSFCLRDLQPSSEYRVWVCVKGYEGVWGFWSEESRVRTLPQLQLEITNIGEDYVRASWKRGVWEGACMEADETEVRQVDGAVSGYQVRVLDEYGEVAAVHQTTYRETTCTIAGLKLSSLYSIEVSAKDTYDEWGLWSTAVRFRTLRPVLIGLQRVGEDFMEMQWSRRPFLSFTGGSEERSTTDSLTDGASNPEGSIEGMELDQYGIMCPDEQVKQWHIRLSCNRIFAGMPQSEDYREIYVEEGQWNYHVGGLFPQTTYSVAVRGQNSVGEWGHWSPSMYVATCPLLDVQVESAGEAFLNIVWQRPIASSGLTEWTQDAANPDTAAEAEDSAAKQPQLRDDEEDQKTNQITGVLRTTTKAEAHMRRFDSDDTHNAYGSIASLALPYLNTPDQYLICFPTEAEVHNYQVTIRPMPTEAPFEEEEEPLIDGARIYETTQPSLRLGNLHPGTRYSVSVREQHIDEAGRPVPGEWGAPSQMVYAQTVPPILVTPTEIGEDYCLVEWHRALSHHTSSLPTDGSPLPDTKSSKDERSDLLVQLPGPTAAGLKTVEYQLQTRRLAEDGVTVYTGPLAMDTIVSLPSSTTTFHIKNLMDSSIYGVLVRAKSENGQWGLWSPTTTFITQSRLVLSVEAVNETDVRVGWTRPRPQWAILASTSDDGGADSSSPVLAMSSESEDEEVEVQEESKEEKVSTAAPLRHVQVGDFSVYEFELTMSGITDSSETCTLTFSRFTKCATVQNLRQDHLYSISVRSLSENQHWSRFSNKATVLTLSPVKVEVVQYTESCSMLRWFRPPSDLSKFATLLAKKRAEVERQCDERERRELFELKRRIQEMESKGEPVSGWLDQAAREEHNSLLRAEAIHHYLSEHIALGDTTCSGYELKVSLKDGELCTPFIPQLECLRLIPTNPQGIGTKDILGGSRRVATLHRNGAAAAATGLSLSGKKKDTTIRASAASLPVDHNEEQVASMPAGESSNDSEVRIAEEGYTELLDVQLNSTVTEVLVKGLSPGASFSIRARARNLVEVWQPWSPETNLETLSSIFLDQSRFGEHYISLYWYRVDPAAMAAAAAEAQEYHSLLLEFRNFVQQDLEDQRSKLSPEDYAALVNRLRRLRVLRRLAAARAQRQVDGELGVVSDPSTPLEGVQLRIISVSGSYSEYYIRNGEGTSFTATGLQPNNLYVCMLCPHYGGDLWGEWLAPLKFMTHNLIQLDIIYISETFVDMEWRRMDNKALSPLDQDDTLLSSRYSEEAQMYQLRITHDDPVTGQGVEEFRNVQACNIIRIDKLEPDMKYTIAVREWDAKGDWGLWCTPCSCATLPAIVVNIDKINEEGAVVSWGRAGKRVNYENDMHVLEDGAETVGYFLKVEEILLNSLPKEAVSAPFSPKSRSLEGDPSHVSPPSRVLSDGNVKAAADEDAAERTSAAAGGVVVATEEEGNQPAREESEKEGDTEGDAETTDVLSENASAVMSHPTFTSPSVKTSLPLGPTVSDDLEGTLAFQFQSGGPLPPDTHPEEHDGTADVGENTHYLLVRKIHSSAEVQAHLTELKPHVVYSVQVMAETTGGQIGLWSSPQHFITMPKLQVSANLIDEHYAMLQWGRSSLQPIISQLGNADVKVTSAVVSTYELEVHGVENDFSFKTVLGGANPLTTFKVDNLSINGAYHARVRSINEEGQDSLWSDTFFFVTLRPLAIQPGQVTENSIAVEWGRPKQTPDQYPAVAPDVAFGADDAVKYHLRMYRGTDEQGPNLFLDKQVNGTVRQFHAGSLVPNNVYIFYIRAVNKDGVWSVWSEGRCVYTMKPLQTSVAAVGEDFLRLEWSRESPDEVHYTAKWDTRASGDATAAERDDPANIFAQSTSWSAGEHEAAMASRSTDPAANHSPHALRQWRQRRSFPLLDMPPAATPVYNSAATVVKSYSLSVRRGEEAEGYTVEVAGDTHQFTLPSLQPDSVYLLSVRALYGNGEWSPWSEVVRTGTYNLLALDLKEVGEDYLSASWQRKANKINMQTLLLGRVEETTCYEIKMHDFSDVPLGEEAEDALLPDREVRSLFFLPTQRQCTVRELLSNHRYRISVRRWYQPHDAFATESGQVPANATIDATLREAIDRAKAVPGVWGQADYVVTLRDMVCSVERVGEEFFQLRWERDPRATPLPVRRQLPAKPIQNYQLRVDELLRDGSGIADSSQGTSFHVDELISPSETTYFTKSLRPNSLYKVEVRCCMEKAWGRWSRPIYVITLPQLVVEVTRIGEETAGVSWRRPREPLTLPDGTTAVLGDEDDGECTYQLDVAGIGFNFQMTKRFKGSRTNYTVKHLDADAAYTVRVRSSDGMRESWSLWSDTVCFATLKPLLVQVSGSTEHFATVEWQRPEQKAEEYTERVEASGVAASSSGIASGTAGGSTSPVILLGNPDAMAFHLCVFNTLETPSVAVVDKQFHKDVTRYRLTGLSADTPYVVIVRACCESIGDWGLWSEEQSFRTLRLLEPVVISVGETYADLTWERGEGDQRSGIRQVSAQPTKYVVVLRSSQHGTVEREITLDDCSVTEDEFKLPYYRMTQLLPGTEYAVAMQPCYGSAADWGLWSKSVTFTSLQSLQLSINAASTSMNLSWSRQSSAPMVGFAEPRKEPTTTSGSASVREKASQRRPTTSFLQNTQNEFTGTVITPSLLATTTSGNTVLQYQLMVCRAEDVALFQKPVDGVEPSAPLQPGAASMPTSFWDTAWLNWGATQNGFAAATIPDMDVAAARTGSSNSPDHSPSAVFFFRKEYSVAESTTGGRGASMQEVIQDLNADTVYLVALRAMDLQRRWGPWIDQEVITPPAAPIKVVLRRVNAQFCSLQWSTVDGENGDVAVNDRHYRFIIEQCYIQMEQPHAAPPTPGNALMATTTTISRKGGATVVYDWQVADTVEDANACGIRINGLLSRLRCRVKCARRLVTADRDSIFSVEHIGPYSDFSETVSLSTGTPPESIVDLHLTSLSRSGATIEWLPPPKPSDAAAGRYTRPTYRIYISNDKDQLYPVLLTTAHRPIYALTNLLPSTTYTVQVMAENADGVSYQNPMIRFGTKPEDDTAVDRPQEGQQPLGVIVTRHGTTDRSLFPGTGDTNEGGDSAEELPPLVPSAANRSRPGTKRSSRRGRSSDGRMTAMQSRIASRAGSMKGKRKKGGSSRATSRGGTPRKSPGKGRKSVSRRRSSNRRGPSNPSATTPVPPSTSAVKSPVLPPLSKSV